MPIDGALLSYFSELFCDGLSLANYLQPNQDGLLNFGNRIALSLLVPTAGLTDIGGPISQFLTDTQRAVGAAICGIPPSDFSPVLPSPPFFGGQCPGVNYRIPVTIFYAQQNGANPGQRASQTTDIGPVTGDFRIVNRSPFVGQNLLYFLANGDSVLVEQTPTGQTSNPYIISSFQIGTLTRIDGQPDSCGDPPVSIPPEVKDPFSIVGPDLEVDGGPGNGGYTIPSPTINFGPVTVNNDNGLQVDIELPEQGICGTFVLTPSPEFKLKPCSPPPLPGSKQPLPEEGDEATEPPEELDEEEQEEEISESDKTISGVFVKFEPLGNFPQTDLPGGSAPALLVPRIGTISFKCVIKDENGDVIEEGWTTPEDIKSVKAYFAAPKKVQVVAHAVAPLPGWKYKSRAFEEDYPPKSPESDRMADEN